MRVRASTHAHIHTLAHTHTHSLRVLTPCPDPPGLGFPCALPSPWMPGSPLPYWLCLPLCFLSHPGWVLPGIHAACHRHCLFVLPQWLWACYYLPPPTPVSWPGEFHGLYSPWGRKESDTTERLSLSPPRAPACRLSRSVVSYSFWLYGLQPARLLCPRDSPGQNTGVGCHALLQGIFPTPGSNSRLSCLVHRQAVLHH